MAVGIFTMRTGSAAIYSPFSMTQSRFYAPDVAKLPKETADQFENRTWRQRLHTTPDGQIYLPVEMLKKATENAASRNSQSVPGKGKQTFTGRFRSDCQVQGDLPDESGVLVYHIARDHKNQRVRGAPYMASDCEPKRLHVSAQGKRGTGARVFRTFPIIKEWIAFPKFVVTDPAIDDDVFEYHLRLAGLSIGIGSFRLENGGRFGRFFLDGAIDWIDNDLDMIMNAA